MGESMGAKHEYGTLGRGTIRWDARFDRSDRIATRCGRVYKLALAYYGGE